MAWTNASRFGGFAATVLAAVGVACGALHAGSQAQAAARSGSEAVLGEPARSVASPALPGNGQATAGAGQGAIVIAQSAGSNRGQAQGAGDGLRQRIEQLEEQLVDMQVVIGTLESLARNPAAGAPAAPALQGGGPSGAYSGSESARIDSLETQIRALTAQIENLSNQVRQMNDRRGDASDVPGLRGGNAVAGYAAQGAPGRPAAPSGQPVPGFGSMTVTPSPGSGDPIGSIIRGNVTTSRAELPAPAAADAGNSKQLYESAYGYLLQQNYGAAEAAFSEFMERHPGDDLAPNAQYWLGESFFVRGQYKQAANSFLKGYRSYAGSAKAPDSLLKLAMSLERLGQRQAACGSFAELFSRFPDAPSHVKSRAQSERRRIGCN